MRRELAILVVVLSVAGTATWLLTSRKAAGPAHLSEPPSVDQNAKGSTSDLSPGTTPGTERRQESESPSSAGSKATSDSTGGMGEPPEMPQEAYVARRVLELQDLAMEDDPASLATILSELNNRVPSIREAAVEAAVQFGSREAIPKLMEAAAQTEDLEEKTSILEAIEFLEQPTLSEALGQAAHPMPNASSGTISNP